MEKLCSTCRRAQPVSEFYVKGGRREARCKTCAKAAVLEWARRNPTKRLANVTRHNEKNREARRISNRKYYRSHKSQYMARLREIWAREPHKREARKAVYLAIKRGELTRGPCECCGATKRVQAHHDDYMKPLEVRWLCTECHGKEHRRAVA